MAYPGSGLLIELADFVDCRPNDVLDYIRSEQLAQRIAIPGVSRGALYEALRGEPRYLQLYEAQHVHVFFEPPFQKALDRPQASSQPVARAMTNRLCLPCAQIYPGFFTAGRYDGSARPSPAVQLGRIYAPREKLEDFNCWYAQDRAPLSEKIDGVTRFRRFMPVTGDRVMVVLYEFRAESVSRESQQWKTAMDTEWSRKARGYFVQSKGSPGIYRLVDWIDAPPG